MDMDEGEKIPVDKFILLIDNRGDQRLIRIKDHKYTDWAS